MMTDTRQADLFDVPAPAGAPFDQPPSRAKRWEEMAEEEEIAEIEAAAELAVPGATDEDENERGELRDDAEREHYRIAALAQSARIERLEWRESNKRPGFSAGQGQYLLEWFEDGGRFYYRTHSEYINGGSGGPFGEVRSKGQAVPIASRDALVLHFMRDVLRSCASAYAHQGWSDGAARWAQAQKLARWAIDQCPPLIFGVDLAEEFETAKAEAERRERARCQMLHDVAALRDQLLSAKYAAEGIDQPRHANAWHRRLYGGGDEFGHADIQVQGEWPGRLRVMIYSARPHYGGPIKDEDTPEQLEAWRARLAAALPVPVHVASREYQLAHYYPAIREEITWWGDPGREYRLRELGMEPTTGRTE